MKVEFFYVQEGECNMSKWLTKKTIGIIVFSSVIAIMGTRAICNSLQDTRNLQLQNNEVVLEYGSELVLDPKLYIKDLLDENIGTEVYRVKEDTYEKVDDVSLLDVGVYALVFTYGEEILEMKIYVVDTQAPIISLKQKEVVLNYGSEWKVEDYVESVRDVIDGELEYTIEGDVDSTSVATYMIKVIASDKHGLIAEDCIQVVVKKKEESKSNKKRR